VITRREDYKYAGGDIDKVIIDGGIMPLRSEGDKRILRGEDVCYLMEYVISIARALVWTDEKVSSGVDRIYNEKAPESFTFSRDITSKRFYPEEGYYTSEQILSLNDVITVLKRFFFIKDGCATVRNSFYELYLYDDPHETTPVCDPSSPDFYFFCSEPVLKENDRTCDYVGENGLLMSEIERVFDDVKKIKHIAIEVFLTSHSAHVEVESGEHPGERYPFGLFDSLVHSAGSEYHTRYFVLGDDTYTFKVEDWVSIESIYSLIRCELSTFDEYHQYYFYIDIKPYSTITRSGGITTVKFNVDRSVISMLMAKVGASIPTEDHYFYFTVTSDGNCYLITKPDPRFNY